MLSSVTKSWLSSPGISSLRELSDGEATDEEAVDETAADEIAADEAAADDVAVRPAAPVRAAAGAAVLFVIFLEICSPRPSSQTPPPAWRETKNIFSDSVPSAGI